MNLPPAPRAPRNQADGLPPAPQLPSDAPAGARSDDDPRRPAFTEWVVANRAGHQISRLIFIFRAPGCGHARRPEGGCTMCGFSALTGHPAAITGDDLVAQLENWLDRTTLPDDLGEIDLYNSGSFFADDEMPPPARDRVLRRLAGLGSSRLRILVESRPEFITPDRVRPATRLFRPGQLEVGIGLETIDDRLREQVIRKGFGHSEFARAVAVLADAGAGLLVNVLLKPPGVADDRTAIAEAVATASYVFDTSRRRQIPARVALQPVFVAPGTWLAAELAAGRYRPPTLPTVAAAAAAIRRLGPVTVGLSDEGPAPHLAPAGCQRCDQPLRAALRRFNATDDPAPLATFTCPCQDGPVAPR